MSFPVKVRYRTRRSSPFRSSDREEFHVLNHPELFLKSHTEFFQLRIVFAEVVTVYPGQELRIKRVRIAKERIDAMTLYRQESISVMRKQGFPALN